jgi:uncharacterized RDD family membrane protein YckC
MSSSQEQQFSGHQLSGWWKRAGAFILDGIFLFFLYALTLVVLGLLLLSTNNGALIALFILLMIVFYFVIAICYYGFSMARPGAANGQSFGKQILGIAVYREDQQEVTFWYAVYRQIIIIGIVIQIASAFTAGIAYFLNYLWPLWDDKRQAFHDKMAGSRVIVSDRQRRAPEQAAGSEDYQPAPE